MNHPPRWRKPLQVTTKTQFEYDEFGDLMGAVTTITISPAVDRDRNRLTYRWKASNGQIRGRGRNATWTRVVQDGEVESGLVTITVRDGHGGSAVRRLQLD